jgi:glycosyltransferase involved in cell wall biosynthesis
MRLIHFALSGDAAGGVERYLADLLATELPEVTHEVVVESPECRWAGAWPWTSAAWSAERGGSRDAADPAALAPDAIAVFHFPPSHRTMDAFLRRGRRFAAFCHDHRWWCASGTRRHARLGRPCAITASTGSCAVRYHALGCGGWRVGPALRGLARAAAGRRALSQAAGVLVASSYMRHEAARHGARDATLRVVPLLSRAVEAGVATREPERPPRLLFASRLTPEKGPDVLLAAFGRMRADARLVVAGSGIWERRIGAAVARHPRREAIELVGWLEPSELRAELERATAVIVPSVWPEPFGLSGIEALAAGRPVVSSTVGGLTDWARAELGVAVTPPGRPVELAAALDAVLADPSWRSRAATDGARWVRERHGRTAHLAALRAALAPLTA